MLTTHQYSNQKRQSIEEVLRRIEEISTLPTVALRVMEVVNDESSGASDLKDAMECDAALSARVLRCVNSSAYATRTEVTNLQQAIAYLGLKQIRNLAMTASVSELFKKDGEIGCYRRLQLWRHLVSVGICARLIAMQRQVANFEDAFLAGLLHDIGIVLEDQHVHKPFCKVIGSLDTAKALAAAERAQLGFDHTQLGEKVAELWRFPNAVRAAMRYHHMSGQCKGEEITIVRCVEVANLICTLKGITSVGMKLVAMSTSVIESLSLTREDVVVLADNLDSELAANATLFEL
ncbi:MAG TPA: HDOD domain-containing protein [Thermoguttaceae bacterium]|nr:HDOD domain-containing protein [Thermoguttaceae bacterium]